MGVLVIVCVLVCVASLTAAESCTAYPCLVWSDEFDSLDFDKWQHEITAGGGGNWEFQHYTNNRTNSYVKNGMLHIKPTLTEDKYGPGFLNSGTLNIWGGSPANLCTGNNWYGCERAGTDTNYINPIQSARLRSVKGFNFRYGKVEIEAQMPKGDWLWPAIWLLPQHNEYGDWPASGEIDLIEIRGNHNLTDENGIQRGNSHGGAAMHWGPWFELNRYELTHGSKDANFADVMHKLEMTWDDEHIAIAYDGADVLSVTPPAGGFWEHGAFPVPEASNPWAYGSKMAPFDRKFHFIMNVAVGGNNGYFPDEWTNHPQPKPWLNPSATGPKDFWLQKDHWYPTWNPTVNNGEDAAMKVNYIRVYKLKDDDGSYTSPPTTTPSVNGGQAIGAQAWVCRVLVAIVWCGITRWQ